MLGPVSFCCQTNRPNKFIWFLSPAGMCWREFRELYNLCHSVVTKLRPNRLNCFLSPAVPICIQAEWTFFSSFHLIVYFFLTKVSHFASKYILDKPSKFISSKGNLALSTVKTTKYINFYVRCDEKQKTVFFFLHKMFE